MGTHDPLHSFFNLYPQILTFHTILFNSAGRMGNGGGDIQGEVGVGALKEKDAGLGVKRKRSEGRGCIERKVCGGERGKGEGIY